MSKRKLNKRAAAAPKAEKLDVGKAHTDLALALEENRIAGVKVAAANALAAKTKQCVSEAQATFDAAVEQVRTSAAPFDTTWWNTGRRAG